MAEKDLLWLTHPECGRHEMGAGHPEQPARLDSVERAVAGSRVAGQRVCAEAPAASQAALERAHDGRHVNSILEAVPESGYLRLDEDTVMNPHTAQAALRAAGACVQAVDSVMGGGRQREDFNDARTGAWHGGGRQREDSNAARTGAWHGGGQKLAFCAVRPPGHHAERANGMGFCLFDNVAVGAAQALAQGASRVAILDFDVHYGNGSVEIFRGNPQVLVCNTYQYPLYPFWPDGGGADNLADAPLRPGAGGAEFREAVKEKWLPALKRHAPELIMVSAGFDAHRDDPLANLNLLEDDYRWVGAQIREQAERHAGGRVVAALEGGYELRALGASVVAFLEGLLGLRPASAS